MGIKYEIEHYGAVEFTEATVAGELGLNGLSNERMIISIEDSKLHMCIHEICDETNITLAKLEDCAN
jgi:hypothetical protein